MSMTANDRAGKLLEPVAAWDHSQPFDPDAWGMAIVAVSRNISAELSRADALAEAVKFGIDAIKDEYHNGSGPGCVLCEAVTHMTNALSAYQAGAGG